MAFVRPPAVIYAPLALLRISGLHMFLQPYVRKVERSNSDSPRMPTSLLAAKAGFKIRRKLV